MNRRHPRTFTPAQAGTWLAAGLDAIALLALLGTGEVHYFVYLIVATLALVASTGLLRPGRGSLLLSFVTLLLGSATAWLFYRVHPIIVAAHATPIALSLIWFSQRAARTRSWRLGMGFISLVLASALTPAMYLPLAIVLFVVLGAVSLSCSFLEEEYRQRGIDPAEQPLPPRYVVRSAGMAVMIFLSAALIFPLLPRVKVPGGIQRGTATTGYTEEVSLTEWNRFTDSDGGGGTALQYFIEDEKTISDIYLGLLRSRVLDSFDGNRWFASSVSGNTSKVDGVVPRLAQDSITIEAIRESINTTALPVPYGTDAVWEMVGNDETRMAPKTKGHQWGQSTYGHRRVSYRIQLTPSHFYQKRKLTKAEAPLAVNLNVPQYYRSDRMNKLQNRIFEGTQNTQQKVTALRRWFSTEEFSSAVRPEDVELAQSRELARYTPIERFIFAVKRGHCELFASSAALLLRLSGVPTRLIAGFRISKPPLAGVLTVRQGDAHAWTEYYDPERGWQPLDLTPRILKSGHTFERFRDAYDLMGAYWNRYVVGFSDSGEAESPAERIQGLLAKPEIDEFAAEVKYAVKENLAWIGLGIFFALMLFGAVYWIVRTYFPTLLSIRFRVREGPLPLRNERLRLERVLQNSGIEVVLDRALPPWNAIREEIRSRFGDAPAKAFDAWRVAYESQRFGQGSRTEGDSLAACRASLGECLALARPSHRAA